MKVRSSSLILMLAAWSSSTWAATPAPAAAPSAAPVAVPAAARSSVPVAQVPPVVTPPAPGKSNVPAPAPSVAGAAQQAATSAPAPAKPQATQAAAPAPVAPAAAPPAAPTIDAMLDLDSIGPESWGKIRDPFAQPMSRELVVTKTELERFAVEQFELVGVMSGPSKLRAMVRTPEAKSILVAENARMGNRGGYVRKITGSALIVREKIPNIMGQDEDVDTVLRLKPKGTMPVQ